MPRKVLVVDDNAINRQLLIYTLTGEYDILEAANGKEALAQLHRHYKMLSAVLLDIVMPEMDGYEVLRKMRDNVLLSQIPVIMVTGSEDEASRVKALSLGANDFILKPFNPEIVKHCLRNNIALRETASILNAIQKDKLTGLYNREAFFEKVSGLIADREPGYYVLSCFDIDYFKLINDQYGAIEGDRILREVGKAVGRNAEQISGIAGRIAADNFAALFPAINKSTNVLKKLLDRTLVSLDRQSVSFSVGRYVVTDLSLPASAIYDRAFIAKQSVKGRYDKHVAYFDDAMLKKLVLDQQITGEMETALKERQFEAWFQPQYDHATGALLGAEALARWRHPRKGIVPPGMFIPLFEQNGFIYELDKYIWRETCRNLRKWMDEGRATLPVSVNISRYGVFRADLIDVLSGLVSEFSLPVDLLRLEITESAFTASSERIVSIVKALIQLGFTVEIDDFGSGFSSLNTLKDVPAQVVKLDMRFLDGAGDSRRGGNILESIVRMAKWLGMTVLAEGVEKQDQADFLKSIGCPFVQGYLYARPMPAEEYEKLLLDADTDVKPRTPEPDGSLFADAFWDPKSIDSAVFNKYSGGACVYEFCNGKIEMVRVTDKYVQTVFGAAMSAAEAMRIEWQTHVSEETARALDDAVAESVRTGDEVAGEYCFLNLPGCPRETYLHTCLRVIATAGDRRLVYCTSINVTAEREAERKNAAITGQLQAVMDSVSSGITAITFHGDDVEYLLINDRYFELLGYTREQYRQIETFSPIYADDRQQVMKACRRVYDSGKPETIEYRAVKQDGSIIWMRVSMTMTRIAGVDRPVQLGIFSDITAQRQAAGELLDNLPGGAALFEYDGKNLYPVHINKRYWELVNRAPVDCADIPITEFVHPDDRMIVEREVASAVSEGRDIACDIRIHFGKDGFRPFHIAGRIVPKADGKYSINAVYTPISDVVMSFQEMLPVALQAVMDSSSEVSFVKGKNLRYICCSRRFALLAGRKSEKELAGQDASCVFSAELAARYEDVDRKVLENGESYVDLDILFPTETGTRHLLFSKYPLLDGQGNVLGVYGTGRDVTEAREMQSRLELLANNIPGGIAIYEGTPDALDQIRLTYFTDGFCRLFGYSREEYERLAAVNPLCLVFVADKKKMYEKIIALARDGVPLDYIYRARVNGDAVKWINVKAVLGEPHGNLLTVNAVFFDITQLHNTLEKLRVSEEVNRLALRQSRNVVGTYDVSTKRMTLSPNLDAMYETALVEENVPESVIREGKVSPGTVEAYSAFFAGIARGDKNGKTLFQRKSTHGWRWMEASFSTIFSDSGEPATAVLTYTDVTESMEKDVAYRKWQQSFRDRKPESYSLYHCNVSKNTVLNATEGLLMLYELGVNSSCLAERTERYARGCVCEEDRARFFALMDRKALLLRFAQGCRTDALDYREKRPDGGIRWLRLTVDLVDFPYSNDVEAYLLFEDIDESKRAELQIIERAETDPLTGVLNRITFAQKVDARIAASQPGARHALLMLDIDGFKLVNDIFGHSMGDQTLVDVAEMLRKGSRRSDLVGRLGGDEFLVFISDIPGETVAAKKAQHICEITRKTFSVEVQISGSVGIALYPEDGDRALQERLVTIAVECRWHKGFLQIRRPRPPKTGTANTSRGRC